MAQQTIFLGTNPNDRTGELLRSGGSMINNNFTELYALQSDTINAGAVAYAAATNDARVQLAINDAVLLSKSRVFVPAQYLPYNPTLVTFNTSVQMVREGGDHSHHDVLAYGGVGGGHAWDIPALQAAINVAAVVGGLVFIPSTFDLTAATLNGVTGWFTGENSGGVRLLSGHSPTVSRHGDTNFVPGDDTPWGQFHVYSQIMAVGAPTAGGADLRLIATKHRSGGIDYDIHLDAQTVNGVRGNGVVFIDIDIKVDEYVQAPFRGHGLRILQTDNSPVIEFPISGGRILVPGSFTGTNGGVHFIARPGTSAGFVIFQNAAATINKFTMSDAGVVTIADATYVGVGAVNSAVATKYRVPAILLQTGNLSTTSTSDASITTFNLLGGTLGTANSCVRIRASGRQATQNGSFNVKFGATVLATVVPLAGENWHVDLTVTRASGTAERATGMTLHNATVQAISATPGETLSGDIVIDFRGSVTAGGTLSLDEAMIEYVSSV